MTNAATLAALTHLIITIVANTANERITRTIFEVAGTTFELTRFQGGRIELYEVDPADGIPMFAGYLEDVQAHIPGAQWRGIQQGLQAHNEAHDAFWGAYLPQADTWLHEQH